MNICLTQLFPSIFNEHFETTFHDAEAYCRHVNELRKYSGKAEVSYKDSMKSEATLINAENASTSVDFCKTLFKYALSSAKMNFLLKSR